MTNTPPQMPTFDYRQEIYRKLIHLSSLWMPVAIFFCEKETSLRLFATGIAAVLCFEVLRRWKNRLARLLNLIFGAALRPDEKGARFKPSGAVYVMAAALFCTLLFPKLIAVTAMSMMLIGDAAAALIGRKFGKIRIFDKSLEGTTAFFVTAFVTALVIAKITPVGNGYIPAAAGAALAAALTELISGKLRINDNLSAPLAAALVLSLLI